MILKIILLSAILIFFTPILKAQSGQPPVVSTYPPARSTNREAVKFRNSGISHTRVREYELAIADYTKAIELDPTFADAFNRRGAVYVDTQKLDLAVADFTKSIELDTDVSIPYMNRGFVYLQQKEYKLALSDFTKLIELDPEGFIG
jgi:tetratricopeptide (TPR) repeat protein